MAVRKRPVLYPQSKSARLDPELFRNPTAAYRGVPFWSWNCKLDVPQLLRQIDYFKQMGFGGFDIHARTGLATEYLGEEFLAAVAACAEKAKEAGMVCWLYDEDRWPSGYAGGLVTRDERYRVKHLLWTATPYQNTPPPRRLLDYTHSARSEDGELLARYEVMLKDGVLSRYRRLKHNDQPSADGRVWYAYLESPFESSWFNGQTYVDTFSREAIEHFITVTHDALKSSVGQYFGGVVPAIFTDEPQFVKKQQFTRAGDGNDLFMPWTTDFAQTYRKAYKQDILDFLPELFWNLVGDQPSLARYRYHDHTAERFSEAFGDTIGKWCERNNIALVGHLLGETYLASQTRGVGESMRPMRSFHLPGIDVLCDAAEYTTAKQAQSVARQLGREGMLSELYGVTNWDFDFVGHKAQGDWQAACGVTARVPHLAWVSMEGEAKRDYPASISYQSPWALEYPLIENHFARLNTVLTRGKPIVRVAVIHPIESLWLAWGPREQVQPEWDELEAILRDITSWLLFGLIDFDFISEGMLATFGLQKGKLFVAGRMKYDAVIVPSLRTMRSTTLKRLERFAKSGGTVIFAGDAPTLVDAKPNPAPKRLAMRSMRVAWNRRRLLDALRPVREVEIRQGDGAPADSLLYQLRLDGKDRHLFICNTDREKPRRDCAVTINGRWSATQFDTMTGKSCAVESRVLGGKTEISWSFEAAGHALLTLVGTTLVSPSADRPEGETSLAPRWREMTRIVDPVPVTLSEPNVLLLDQPAWRLGGGAWHPPEEMLRLGNKVREQLNLPPLTGREPQPWADRSPRPVLAQLQLRFPIHSDIAVHAPLLALENTENAQIHLDGRPAALHVAGWWVDEAIQTVKLNSLAPGKHELMLTIPFTRKTSLEWCYLLGDFGVEVRGRQSHIIPKVKTLAFGDWTHQGLPFYAGNVTYHCTLQGDGRETMLEVARFKNPLLSINLDGQLAGKIAFPPFQLNLGPLAAGAHKLDIEAFGNRANAFGPLHNSDENLKWAGPPAWRSTGNNWTYGYQLKRMGILVAPTIKTAE